ncbi:rRNA processing protein Fcf2 [Pseudohyphozyma bogoriensis]|nr:rRNA processing protein Fcf2 [Pseudohyphozyma bogoriensis]
MGETSASDRSTDPQTSITSTLVSNPSLPSSAASASSSSGSEDSSASESDSDDASDEDDDERETQERLRDLFLKAKASAREKAKQSKEGGSTGDGLAGQDELVLFGDEDDEDEGGSTPKASSSKTTLPRSLTKPLGAQVPTLSSASTSTTKSKGKGKAVEGTGITLAQDLAGVIEGEHTGKGDKWGQAPLVPMSKKQRKAAQPRTAGPKWFDMPAPDMTPELKREIQAMRLRNSLDPKRFYRGGAKEDKKMPEFFSVGHILPSQRGASTAAPAIARKRTFVEELVEDEQAKAYTKRKTAEVMRRGMSGRKGKARRK